MLELMTPTGRFCTPLHPLNDKHYVAIVAGSGITPILSMLQTTLEIETESRFTLIYGNRTKESTMFRDELDELESRYADRLEILHVLSREPHHVPDLSGRIDRDKLEGWLGDDARARRASTSGSCAGRSSWSRTARDTLVEHGVDARAHPPRALLRLRQERRQAARGATQAAHVTFTLSGREETVDAQARRLDPRGGAPGRAPTPRTRAWAAPAAPAARSSSTGTVEMDHNFALGKAELDAGYVLTCQSHPTSPTVTVDYDA